MAPRGRSRVGTGATMAGEESRGVSECPIIGALHTYTHTRAHTVRLDTMTAARVISADGQAGSPGSRNRHCRRHRYLPLSVSGSRQDTHTHTHNVHTQGGGGGLALAQRADSTPSPPCLSYTKVRN